MTLRKSTIALLVAAALMPLAQGAARAQTAPPPPTPPATQATHAYSQAELDQMLAPVALYPDALLSQVLMASTYPIEVVEAARWTRANPGLQGDAAVRAVENQDWDPSVKSLAAFPQILQRMDEQLQWTQSLGDAFLGQEPQVMDTVQQLRRRAQAAGNLQSTEQIHVAQQGPAIVIESPPQAVYVPYYDPTIVYGTWWWPAYRPVAWAPWPGYVRPRPGVSVGFWFGSPVGVSASFFFGNFDWGRHDVRVVRPTAYYYKPPTVVVNRTTVINRKVTVNEWQHDPGHRRGTAYRSPEVRQRFANAQAPRAPAPQAAQRAKVQPHAQPREEHKQARLQERPKAEVRPHPEAPARERPQAKVQERPQAKVQERPQAQARQDPRHAEPRPAPQARQEPREEHREPHQEKRQEQHEERGSKGGGDKS